MLDNNQVTWRAPSNIAIVKYWGKIHRQFPKNPSISMTLKNCFSETTMKWEKKNSSDIQVDLLFHGQKNEKFQEKIKNYFSSVLDIVPELTQYKFKIESTNSFPHSSGIASSASAFAALGSCLSDFVAQVRGEPFSESQAKILARIGSGSATRSFNGPWVIWGENDYAESSQEMGINLPAIHPVFQNLKDAIVLIDEGEKSVSSSAGHNLMNGHPFAEEKFKLSFDHTKELISVLLTGDFEGFKAICEAEAMLLHGMMMTSNPSYILMKPKTLEVIEKLKKFQADSKLPVTYTLDAGPNIHILYAESAAEQVEKFLSGLELKVLFDESSMGAQKV